MENYTKGEIKEIDDPSDFQIDKSGLGMKVNAGSKIRNLMGFALTKFMDSDMRQIRWSGSGNAVAKTVSCAEIMKRKVKNLHQVTKIKYRRIEEYWEPKIDGLERLKVNKDVPAISILLSKDPMNSSEPGYQSPGPFDTFWAGLVHSDKPPPQRPRPQGRKPAGRSRGGRKGGKEGQEKGDNTDKDNNQGNQTFRSRNNNKKSKNTAGQSKSETVTGSAQNNSGKQR